MKKDLTVTLSVMILLIIIVGIVPFTLSRQWMDYYTVLSRNIKLNSTYGNLEFNMGILNERVYAAKIPLSVTDREFILKQHKQNVNLLQTITEDHNTHTGYLAEHNPKIRHLYLGKLSKILNLILATDNVSQLTIRNLYKEQFNKDTKYLIELIQNCKESLNTDFEQDIKSTQKSIQDGTLFIMFSSILLGFILMSVAINRISNLHGRIEQQLMDIEEINKELEETLLLNITIQEDERLRIARDIHDATIQDLISIMRHITVKDRSTIKEELRGIVNQIREICQNLRPLILEELGLFPAIEWLFNKLTDQGVVFSAELEGTVQHLPHNIDLTIFRVAQEIASNIQKHAYASTVHLVLSYQAKYIRLKIEDNGIGFDSSTTFSKNTLGIRGIIERVKSVKGTINIESTVKKGSVFTVYIPI